MAEIKWEDLPEEIQTLQNPPSPPREGACISEQPVCHPDPRVTAQLTDEPAEPKTLPWRIANAQKGDLLLTPGSATGTIGGLLSSLDPPQHFTHMGIMTEDFEEVRHATTNEKWLKRFYNGSILGIEKAPTEGIFENELRFQWPGTITQRVKHAYDAWFMDHYEKDADGNFLLDDEGEKIPSKDTSALDAQTGKRFHISALSFGPTWVRLADKERRLWPVIVQPCPRQETQEIRDALHRVADAAREIRGHYSFYAYTNAEAALNGDKDGPARLEDREIDPASDCKGAGAPEIPVTRTQPMVCSTFVWLAVRRANIKAPALGRKQIVLDGRTLLGIHPPQVGVCIEESHVRRQPFIDKVDADTLDGLYFYGAAERRKAADWLHAHEIQQVLDGLEEALPGVAVRLGGAAALFHVGTLLTILTGLPLQLAAAALGISLVELQDLIVLLSDMPDDVANQVCNAFAADRCQTEAKDDEKWKDDSVGYTVSPDNILNSWAAPNPERTDVIHGIYGFNDRIKLSPPMLMKVTPPLSAWKISQGRTIAGGKVFYKAANNQEIGVPAKVRIGCSWTIADSNGHFRFKDIPSGTYWCRGYYNDISQHVIMDSDNTPNEATRTRKVEIPLGGGATNLRVELQAPPATRREVLFEVNVDTQHKRVIGKDRWLHSHFDLQPAYLGLDYFPEGHPDFEKNRKAQRLAVGEIQDFGKSQVRLDVEIREDKTVKILLRGRLVEGGENEDDNVGGWLVEQEIIVEEMQSPKDPPHKVEIHVEKSGLEPVHSWTTLRIHNLPVTW